MDTTSHSNRSSSRVSFLSGSLVGLVLLVAGTGCSAGALGTESADGEVGTTHQALLSGTFPFCTGTSCSWGGISFNSTDVQTAWNTWKNDHITYPAAHGFNAGCAGCIKVWKSDNTSGISQTTTSESEAYGMLASFYFNDQTSFDGLYKYVVAHSRNGHRGLMEWCLNSSNSACNANVGSAMDATVDIGLALVAACKKWGSNANFNYCTEATTVLDNMYTYEINSNTDTLPNPYPGPGDNWSNNAVDPSYFSPGHWLVFNGFEGGSRWSAVKSLAATNINDVQGNHGQCSRLVYDWSVPGGAAYNGQNLWGWEAFRIPWRQALANEWYGDPQATITISEIGGFFRRTPTASWLASLNMSGGGGCCNGSAGPTAGAAVAVIAADSYTDPSALPCGFANSSTTISRQAAYDAMLNTVSPSAVFPTEGYSYFNNYWRMMGMLAVTGNMPNPLGFSISNMYGTSTMWGAADWDSGYSKGTCKSDSAVVGISRNTGETYSHRVLCEDNNLTGGQVAVLSGTSDHRRASRSGDWSPGNWKYECGANEYVSGFSQSATTFDAHAVRCSSGAGQTSGCETRNLTAADGGNTNVGDWDSGYYKSSCAAGKVAVGVSVNPTTLNPATLLCCSK